METHKAMTLEDLARQVGVSRSLVSIAFTGNGRIAPKTRERILREARKHNYQPNPHAQRLAGGRNQNTVALFSLGLDFGVTTHKIKLIQDLLSKRGFHVPLYAYGDYSSTETMRQVELMGALRQQQPRAIVCVTRALEPEALQELKRYHADGGEVVAYDYQSELDCDHVIFDREDNNYRTARHLLELGHRKLGLYMEGAVKPSVEMELTGSRVQGFTRALSEWDMPVNPDWLFYGLGLEEGGALLAHNFLALQESERPTAICVVNDRSAFAFVNQIRRAGVRVPEDVSVVCHDDQPVAQYASVPLTTATHPVHKIAEGVVGLLISRLNGSYQGAARQHIVRGDLIVRESTAPPRQS